MSSIITKFMTAVTEPQFKLARDLMAMAIADGKITPEEHEAMSSICHIEHIDEHQLMESLSTSNGSICEIPPTIKEREEYLRDLILLIGADRYRAPRKPLFQFIHGYEQHGLRALVHKSRANDQKIHYLTLDHSDNMYIQNSIPY